MKIAQSYVAMQGRSEYVRQHTITESLRTFKGQETNGAQAPTQTRALPGSIRMALSAAGYDKLRDDLAKSAAAAAPSTESAEDASEAPALTDKEMAKIKLIEDFVYVLTGKKLKIKIPKQVSTQQAEQAQQVQAVAVQKGEVPRRVGWGMDYQYHERLYESESVQFATSGTVSTEDGRNISFDLNFSMSREFLSETRISIQAGDVPVDPLTLNFGKAAATLGARNFQFDLDTDGIKDSISFVGEGSGFLALDNNGNGTIDNGSELFGPQSGNGFTELAAHDADDNGWIDENDPVFDNLRIWSMDGEGTLQLEALGKAGVGAIYLGNVTTPYRLMGPDGQVNGQISRSGVFLQENGVAGTIQHVDLHI